MARRGRGYPIQPFWRRRALTAASGQNVALPVAAETDAAQAFNRRKTRALPVDNELYTPSYAAVVGALSLGSRYTLDDTSGTVAAAAVGSAGSYGGTVTLSASRIVKDAGTAVTTDGSTGFIQIPAAAGAVGVGFWFREGTGSAAGIPMCRDNTTAGGTGWYLDTTGTNPVVRAGGTNHTVTTVLSSALHTGDHLVVIQTDGTNVSFIVDNQIVDTWVKVAAFTTNTWFFGRNGGVTAAGNYWNGTWDEIFFPTTLLSATDVTNLWNAGTSATVGGAQALGRVKKLALPIATTTSAAQPLGRVKSRVLPVATETDTANRFGRPLPIARETDAAQALARVKSRVLPISTETDAAQTITRAATSHTLPVAVETDTAQTLGRRKTRALPVATETDAAQTLGRVRSRAITPATESDAAQPLARSKTRALPITSETDAAQPVGRRKQLSLPPATGTSTAQPLGRVKTRALGPASSANTAQALARVKSRLLGPATETDKANRFGRPLPIARETDTAVTINRRGTFIPATESDTARPFGRVKTRILPTATESDLPQTFARRKTRVLPITVETDTARVFGRQKARLITPATETDAARLLARSKTLLLGTAVELDVAREFGGAGQPNYTDAIAVIVRRTIAHVAERTIAEIAHRPHGTVLERTAARVASRTRGTTARTGDPP
jgi:hypothetical protein